MGSQTLFYALEADERELAEFCRQLGLRAVPAEIATGAAIEPAPLTAFAAPPESPSYLVPDGVPPEGVTYLDRAPHAPGRAELSPDKSAVVEVVRGPVKAGAILGHGRFYCDTRKTHPFYKDARRAYDRIARQLRKWPSGASESFRFTFHIGPAAAAAARAGRLVLEHGAGVVTLAEESH